MTDKTQITRSHIVLAAFAGVLGGFILTVLVLQDPLQLFEQNTEAGGSEAQVENQSGLWTCGMHPEIILEESGTCPICQMDLVPLRTGEEPSHQGHAEKAEAWVCPEHSMIEEDGPGTCPIGGRELVRIESATAGAGDREILFYRNPMDPTITSPVPAKDSMGMDYVPVYADETEAAASQGVAVRIDPVVVQNMNVRTAWVERRDLSRPIRTVGYLDYDQERMVTVTTKYSGWVEKVHVNYVGEPVEKGQPLFEVYSPELVQTEQELLSALDFARDMNQAPEDSRRRALALVEAARERLGYWDISDDQIRKLEETGKVFRTLTVVAPSEGLVMKRMSGLEGMAVRPGMEIFHIADIKSLWLSVEIFEDQVAWVKEKTPAEVSLTYLPGKSFRGVVRYLDPEFSEKTRTLRVKIEVPNPTGELRKGMFATVVFAPLAVADAVVVPAQAVLRTGRRNVVVLAQGNGRFAPREVEVGHETEGYTQILTGLQGGEEVVTSAQFLLDSESKLREAIQKMIAQKSLASSAEPGHSH